METCDPDLIFLKKYIFLSPVFPVIVNFKKLKIYMKYMCLLFSHLKQTLLNEKRKGVYASGIFFFKLQCFWKWVSTYILVRYSSLALQSFAFMSKLSALLRRSHVSQLCILTSLSSSSPLAWLGRYHKCGIIRGNLMLTPPF